jgi:hypothetical protein
MPVKTHWWFIQGGLADVVVGKTKFKNHQRIPVTESTVLTL